ncbi:MAG TPA: heme-binding protein [Candidatus Binatia bacterium]|nr:heme-binding protein [Candidatus Binatia bacterium]
MKLTIDKASTIVDQALAHARATKIRPLCVAVLDGGGNLKALKRDDGASILRPTIAISKAWGAIGMGESSRHLGNRLKEMPAFLGRALGHERGQGRAGSRRRADYGRGHNYRCRRRQRR